MHAHQRFIYVTADFNDKPIELKNEKNVVVKTFHVSQKAGLYVIQVKALLRGRLFRQKISHYGTGGCSSLIEYNENKGRLAYMEDYNTIVVMSLP